MLVKICGISNALDAEVSFQAGADLLGFVMGGRVLPVEVEPPAQLIREVIRSLPERKKAVLVTHLGCPAEILALAEYLQVGGIQLSEPLLLAAVQQVRRAWRGLLIKTVVIEQTPAVELLDELEGQVDFFLIDSRVSGYIGGTGQTSDWELAAGAVQASKRPVFLAGGLTPDNLVQAIAKVHPAGVDVSTGVSTHSARYLRKDRKDPGKINRFIETARR